MTGTYHDDLRSPDGQAIFGCESPEGTERAYGDGARPGRLSQWERQAPVLAQGLVPQIGRNWLPIAKFSIDFRRQAREKSDRMAFRSRADLQNHSIGRLQRGIVPLAVGRSSDFHELGCHPGNVRITG